MTITLTDPKTLTPTFYRLINRRHQCKGCGDTTAHSEVYAMVAVRGSGYTGIPCHLTADIIHNLPIQVETSSLETTPFCAKCWRPGMLNHLPTPDPQTQKPPGLSWVGLGGLKDPKPKPQPKQPKSTPKPKTYTIDDLDID